MDNIVLKIAQISDLHITKHRNLLEPLIEHINKETLDLVVVTGDTVHSKDVELFKIAEKGLNRIKHKVVVLPGEYDGGDLWCEYFGDRYKSINLNDYCIDFLDTSYMRHRFAVGWGDTLKEEDPEQYEWLIERLKIDKYHLIFSHHPHSYIPKEIGDEFLQDNVRAIFSGHFRQPSKFYFDYEKPRRHFEKGLLCVPLKFHGSSCYLLILIKDNDEIINIPRMIDVKRTAW